MTIELSDTDEQELRITAEANGLSLEEYVGDIFRHEAREDAKDRAAFEEHERNPDPSPRKTRVDLRRVLGKPV